MMRSMRSGRMLLSTCLGVLGLGLGLGSCGKATDGTDLLLDSNTNWLKRCEVDSECSGSLRCYCGQCTQPCAAVNECSLLSGAGCSASGPALCGDQAGAGGLCVMECGNDGHCAADFTCNANQCVPRPTPSEGPCAAIGRPTWDGVFESIAADLDVLDAADSRFARYFTVADRWRSPGCSSSLDPARLALSKLTNSLSRNALVVQPEAIDADRTVYRIDLRDYDWNQVVSVGGQSYPDAWAALIASDPFALPFVGEEANFATGKTGTDRPVLFVSSFIAAGTRSEVYYALTGVPPTQEQLLAELGIGAEFPGLPNLQVGFTEGGREFVAQNWEVQVRAGNIWQVSEFGRGESSLFETPLEIPLGQRELIFTLPNGLHAFAFMSSDGQRLDTWQATPDLAERDGAARAPRSNLRRHSGGVAVRDEVRQFLAENPERFDPTTAQLIRERYRSDAELQNALYGINRLNREALEAFGIVPALPEPITFVFADFDGDLTLADAAGELLVSEDELLDELSNLSPQLGVLDGGSISRTDFASLFVATTCIMTVVLENQVDISACDEAL